MNFPSPQFSSVSLFSGCGGSDLGMRCAGIETEWANDNDEAACSLYENLYKKGVINCGDIAAFNKFQKTDILAGCYPCQGFSQGGNRAAEQDNRNFLYRQFGRVLKQIRPKAFIVENVNGMRFQQNRKLFHNQLRYFRMTGYRISYKMLDAKDYGLAQDRKRIFIVGIRSSEKKIFQFPSPTHGDNKTPYVTLRNAILRYRIAPKGSYNEEPFHWYYMSRNRRRDWDAQSPCIVANWRHLGLHPDSPPLTKVEENRWEFTGKGFARRYSFLEAAALQGFPDPKAFSTGSTKDKIRCIGNAVPPPLFAAVSKALVEQIL